MTGGTIQRAASSAVVRRADRRVAGVSRIAVLRANALGDLVVALPALDALRAAYPDAEITLLGRALHAALLGDRRGPVDRVVALPSGALGDQSEPTDRSEGDAGNERRRAVLDRLADVRFDVAIQLHGGGRHSNPFVAALGAGVTAGSRAPDAAPLDRWLPYERWQNEVVRCLDVVSLVGAEPMGLEPRLDAVDTDRCQLARELPEIAGQRYVVIHPGATDPRRRWPADRFGTIAAALAVEDPRRRIVVTGTEPEALEIGAVAAAVPSPGAIVADRLSLPALLALVAEADLVVANDSGPLHLAAAAGARTVGVFWIGNVITNGPLSRRRHRSLVSWQLACPECGRGGGEARCPHDASFVADIPVAAVLGAASDLLGAASPSVGS